MAGDREAVGRADAAHSHPVYHPGSAAQRGHEPLLCRACHFPRGAALPPSFWRGGRDSSLGPDVLRKSGRGGRSRGGRDPGLWREGRRRRKRLGRAASRGTLRDVDAAASCGAVRDEAHSCVLNVRAALQRTLDSTKERSQPWGNTCEGVSSAVCTLPRVPAQRPMDVSRMSVPRTPGAPRLSSGRP